MPILPGVNYDYFLSYAHGSPDLTAWSARVDNKLRGALHFLLADRNQQLSVFRDSQALQGNGYLTPQLKAAVQSSGAIVIILSRLYKESWWCQQEAEWFRAVARDEPERIFVICAQNLPENEWPESLKLNGERMVGYVFSDQDPGALPYGWFEQHDQLDAAVARLSKAIFKYLDNRRKVPPPAPAIDNNRPRLFLGFVTEDVEKERMDLANRLSADFIVVAPTIPDDLGEIYDVAAAATQDCAALVQICGPASGRWKRSADGYVAGQIRLFEAMPLPIWLMSAATLDPARLVSSPYAEFMAPRMDRLRPEPTAADLLGLLAPPPPAPLNAAGIACTIFIQSRQTYVEIERELREGLYAAGMREGISFTFLPRPPIYVAETAHQIEALLKQRRQRLGKIHAEILFLTNNLEFLDEDMKEYGRDFSSGTATWPAAIIDATAVPVVTEAEMGHPVFRQNDPQFITDLTGWLHRCVTGKVQL